MLTDPVEVGTVRSLYRHPVKSMRSEELREAQVGWHGLAGDRRYAFARAGDASGFPWLTARQVPKLLLYQPYLVEPARGDDSPVGVATPDGRDLPIESPELLEEVSEGGRWPSRLLHLSRGTFDSMPVSLISAATIAGLGNAVGRDLDPRRFRQNILVDLASGQPFAEEGWIGRLVALGDQEDSARIRLIRRDPRCMMTNLDPDTATQDGRVLREIVASRDGCLGMYGHVERPGTIRAGDAILMERS